MAITKEQAIAVVRELDKQNKAECIEQIRVVFTKLKIENKTIKRLSKAYNGPLPTPMEFSIEIGKKKGKKSTTHRKKAK